MNIKSDPKDCPFLAVPNDMKPIIALINRAAHDCTELLNTHLELLGLSVKSFLILGAAYKNTSFSQHDIAKSLFIDRSTMVTLIDELEQRDLVERTRHPDDRRQYRIVLTEQGERVFKEAREIAYQTENEYLTVLSDEQKKNLRETLLLVLGGQSSTDAGCC